MLLHVTTLAELISMGEVWTGIGRKLNMNCWELAAMGGEAIAGYNLGIWEQDVGNIDRAVNHFLISTGDGCECDPSLTVIRQLCSNGHAAKDDFEKALRAHKEAKDEMKSDQRGAAAASSWSKRSASTQK